MANIITNTKVNSKVIQISNSLTSALLEMLCLAGADIAVEKYQKDLIIWFAQHDWNLRGIGVQGFDISEIIWDDELFDEQKKFIIRLLRLAINRTNWNLLDYVPNERLLEKLEDLKKMVAEFKREHIELECEEAIFDFDEAVQQYDQCEKHRIFKHCMGCIICGNMVKN